MLAFASRAATSGLLATSSGRFAVHLSSLAFIDDVRRRCDAGYMTIAVLDTTLHDRRPQLRPENSRVPEHLAQSQDPRCGHDGGMVRKMVVVFAFPKRLQITIALESSKVVATTIPDLNTCFLKSS